MAESSKPAVAAERQLLRYGFMGVAINLAAYLLFLAIVHAGIDPKVAISFLYPAGATMGFFGHRWTFAHGGGWSGALVRYSLAHACGYLINLAMLAVLVDRLGYPHQGVQAAAIFTVAAFLFVVFRLFVFPAGRTDVPGPRHEGFEPAYFAELVSLEAGNFWFRSRNRLIVWALGKYRPGFRSLLEVGCGTGYVLSGIAAAFPGARLVGTEVYAEGLAQAATRLPGIAFAQVDARALPYRSEFEVIGAFDVIEHIAEDEAVLAQAHAALQPGGLLLLTVPQHAWLWSPADAYARHVRRYAAGELHAKVRAAGFEVLRSTSFVSVLLPAMVASRLLRREDAAGGFDPRAEFRIPGTLNAMLESLLALERRLIALGLDFPCGGSRLVVARKT